MNHLLFSLPLVGVYNYVKVNFTCDISKLISQVKSLFRI